jgi:hypothetical protein
LERENAHEMEGFMERTIAINPNVTEIRTNGPFEPAAGLGRARAIGSVGRTAARPVVRVPQAKQESFSTNMTVGR